MHGQYPQHEARLDHHLNYRHYLTTHYAPWLTPTRLLRIWRGWPGASHVETGEGVYISDWSRYFLIAHIVFFRKGLVWIFLSTIAYVPPVVSGANVIFSFPRLIMA
jgi:hypothetical protein